MTLRIIGARESRIRRETDYQISNVPFGVRRMEEVA